MNSLIVISKHVSDEIVQLLCLLDCCVVGSPRDVVELGAAAEVLESI